MIVGRLQMSEEFKLIPSLVYYFIEIFILWGAVIWGGCYQQIKMKNLKNNEDRKSFYFGRINGNNRLKHRNTMMDVISSTFMLVWILTILILLCFTIVNPDVQLRAFWQGTGKFIDDIPAEMFGGLSIVAITTALVGVKKSTWFGFDIYDILREFSVVRKTCTSLVLTCVCRILIFVAPIIFNIFGYEEYFVVRVLIVFCFLIYLVYLTEIMWVVIEILFGNNIDRFCANNLYRFLRLRKMSKSQYDEEEIANIMEYLLDEYVDKMRKIGCEKLVAISYDTNINPNGERLKQKKMWSSIVVAGFMTVLAFLMTLVPYPEVSKWGFQWVMVIVSFLLFVTLVILIMDLVDYLLLCVMDGCHIDLSIKRKKYILEIRHCLRKENMLSVCGEWKIF